ncbi:hypothetical protein GCM10010404_89170 [Nonomuraea africana]|uniref:Uncharacterized protein n=1 Tax=Nonomuraea africana TaxID=46171 RepID=A0ABR9KEM7_9ACTN|nr:hypothetical protein [Nonomuraea africana]MBE1560452.1 hypothetical protein [Nonomuraea africana]
MTFTEDQHVVEALAPDGADKPLGVGVRTWRPGRCGDDSDAGAGQDLVERPGELAVAVTEISWRNTKISRSLDTSLRASSISQPIRRTKIRYSSRENTSFEGR